ncbi:MAG: glutamate--tRNA ligase [Marine Group II euryarchaeote MED-G38]|nr:glutamate--tRNA ligase [Euryarchaeota archaeon]OUV24200.1 MAG: glutamate--tRNA ligase [Euryarchaeota archaeon TMED97]PDH22164.1 MAG: glutamate--tRNA ligase [Marine Group II euryarchaeote MED-G38]|tara:strand:+ start:13821 stop:15551 length:1731 start_codon:yes stop_codon:yes gene_type:complete
MSEEEDWGIEIENIVRKYALQNSLEYKGKGVSGSVLGRIMSERKDLRSKAKLLKSYVESEVTRANNIAKEHGIGHIERLLAKENPDALIRKKQKRRVGLPDLNNAENRKVVLRFAPNPNGPLTIGHSRGVVVNSKFAEKYNGKLILRFDDTDTKVKPPLLDAYKWIEEDYEWITGRKPDVIIKASERMPIYLKYAQEMISNGFGYVCRCSSKEFKKLRDDGVSSPYRERSIEENLEDWDKMISGDIEEGDAVVRVKTSMEIPNPALRDWPALRIQHRKHPLVGEKYKVWPLLDFQSAIEDHEQGVSHIIRGKDLMDSTRKQKLLYEHFQWEYPETLYWGRVKVFEFGGFSTSGMKNSIMRNEYSGWDDIRLPTIKSLRRRGFNASSLNDFWIDLGLSQKDISISMQTLESFNVKKIDSLTARRSFIREPIEIDLKIEGINPIILKIPNHPENLVEGHREWIIDENNCKIYIEKQDVEKSDKIRLKDFASIKINKKNGNIESMDIIDKRPIVHWLPKNNSRDAILYIPSEKDVLIQEGLLEMKDISEGMICQLERVGFAKIEKIPNTGPIEMIWLHG